MGPGKDMCKYGGKLTLVLFSLVLLVSAPNLFSYSVLTHEAVVDSVWAELIEPMLRQKTRNPCQQRGGIHWEESTPNWVSSHCRALRS